MFKKCIAIVLLASIFQGCHSLEQKKDEPFDRFAFSSEKTFPTFRESGFPSESFESYDQRVQSYIKSRVGPWYESLGKSPYYNKLSLADKIKYSSPRELKPICLPNQQPKGMILFHGLFKDANDLFQIASHIHQQEPCTWILMPLMAGHGTVPGDTIHLDAKTDWYLPAKRLLHYVQQEQNLSSITLLGYSAGGAIVMALADQFNQSSPEQDKQHHQPHKVILLSPALKVQQPFLLKATTIVRHFLTYGGKGDDDFSFSYDSYTYDIYAEFDGLLSLMDDVLKNSPPMQAQVFIDIQDKTVDAEKTINYICEHSERTEGLVFASEGHALNFENCKGHNIITEPYLDGFEAYGHINLINPLDDPWYTTDAFYCYDGFLDLYGKQFDTHCDELMTWTKSHSFDYDDKKLMSLRNPHFDRMIRSMLEFMNH
ncbi:MAG: serine aminopeptidase domain-containing protein [Candidatus Comchoanobacterales bacterium]